MQVLVWLAAVLASIAGAQPIAASPSPARVFVETSSLAERLQVELEKELPLGSVVKRREDADFAVRLDRDLKDPEQLSIEVREATGAIVLERAIAVSGGLVPALRLAVLLVREALGTSTAPSRGSSEPARPPGPDVGSSEAPAGASEPARPSASILGSSTPRPGPGAPAPGAPEPSVDRPLGRAISSSPWSLDLAASAVAIPWQRPLTPPQLGIGLMAELERGPLFFTFEAIASGHVCCTRSTVELSGSAREVILTLGAGLRFWRSGAWSLSGSGSAGADFLNGEARASTNVFAGPGTPQAFRAVLAIAEVSLALDLELSAAVTALLRVGGKLTFNSHRVFLPAGFGGPDGDTRPLDTGILVPWGALGVAWKIF